MAVEKCHYKIPIPDYAAGFQNTSKFRIAHFIVDLGQRQTNALPRADLACGYDPIRSLRFSRTPWLQHSP